jgi:hypothetical protein
VLSTAGKQRKESRDVSRQSRSGVFVGVFVLVWCLVLLFLILSEFTDVVSSCSTRTGIHTVPWDTLKLKLLTPMSYRRLMDRPSRDSFRASLDLVRVHRYRTVQSFQEPIHNQCLHIFVHNRADAPIHTRNLNLSVLQTQI